MFRSLLYSPLLLSALSYTVNFIGIEDPKILRSLKNSSDLVKLQEHPPSSTSALRYRAEGDTEAFLKILRAYGYYDAAISYDIHQNEENAKVIVYFKKGSPYTLSSYLVFDRDGCNNLASLPHCPPFTPTSLGLNLKKTVRSLDIINAELNLLSSLAKCGYPLASIEKRKVIVDMQEKNIEASVCIDQGPLSKFGPVSILGLKKVKPEFILRRIYWEEGELYTELDVEKTQNKLLKSNLFSSIMISHDESLNEKDELPMKLRVSEAKHRQVSLGPFYATVDGPGGVFTWTHRNLKGLGESLSIDGEFSKRYLTGIITYKKPDLFVLDQNLRLLGQIERQDLYAYNAFIYRGATFLDKTVTEKSYVSLGVEAQRVLVTDSANNKLYLFIDVPCLFKYNNANDLMNPTKGYTLTYQPQLFQSIQQSSQKFIKQRLTATFYFPITEKVLTFAGRVQLGSIAGTRQANVPIPLLFLGGSEDDLRGYRYLTVSPLDSKGRPLGGRSAIFLSIETRLRFGNFGIVPFADFGTVGFKELPQVDTKWFKSVGVGLRYFTSFGPLRFDVGFPLDRREHIDHAYRFYASIGQAY